MRNNAARTAAGIARRPRSFADSLKRNWFLLGIVAVVALGFLAPRAGRGLNPGSATTNAIVVVQFLILGFTVPTESLLRGLSGWRLHLTAQVLIWVVSPLFFALTSMPLRGFVDPGLMVGIVALGALPTTVASCVVFTQLSGGNVSGAMFNSALSNAAGIILAPLLLSVLLRGSGQALPPDQALAVFTDLGGKMLVPALIGQLLRLALARFADRKRGLFGIVANLLILATVFFAVSKSAGHPAFASGLAGLMAPIAYLATAHLALVGLAWAAARAQRFSREDLIALLFVAPQRTLVMGVPLLGIYFAHNPELLGMAVLPLLFYHPFQLLVAGVIRGVVNRSA
jgi:sodium/bile acid cotransporter 7